jgi:hypothetical protein
MKFTIQRDSDILDPGGPRYSFHGSFTERELLDLRLTGLDRAILQNCKTPPDFLLALETIYRAHQAKKNEAGNV